MRSNVVWVSLPKYLKLLSGGLQAVPMEYEVKHDVVTIFLGNRQ